MDLNATSMMTKGVQEGIIAGFIYDVISLTIAFILVKIFYEKLYMKWKWGGWEIKVYNNIEKDNEEPLTIRNLSTHSAKRIVNDEGELSVYVKGIISPYARLTIDIASRNAIDIGLIDIGVKSKKKILIDLSKNPSEKDSKTEK